MSSRDVAKSKKTLKEDGTETYIIRMRLTIRGFEDWFSHLTENYAGASSRLSQRIIFSEVACRPGWILVTIDVEKAILHGMTFAEIEAATGEPQRHSHFSLPPGSAAVLRQIPGFETFDERTECLRSIKPGTGTRGAPGASSLKLASVTHGPDCRMKPTHIDPQLEVFHEGCELTALCAKHIDDLKLGAPRAVVVKLIAALEQIFW